MIDYKQHINILKLNRAANADHPKFVAACDAAITALAENQQLKNRCYALSEGTLCMFCRMECERRNDKINSSNNLINTLL